MRRTTFVAVAVLSSLAFGAWANDGVELALRGKSLVSIGSAASMIEPGTPPTSSKDGPILPFMGEPEQMVPRANDCMGRQVCYDAGSGHIVVRPAREYMPRMNGLTPENVSVRHRTVTFTYSFK